MFPGYRPGTGPSRHYEIRLSLTQLCDVNKASLQVLGSDQCAPYSFGVDIPPRRGLGVEALPCRGAAMTPPTVSQRRPAMGVVEICLMRDTSSAPSRADSSPPFCNLSTPYQSGVRCADD